ncbi:MAG TPA: hypothetical protein DCF45_04375 [Gammaproteobacteria bacterium]|nr:hypothetical protein [Gammaproteobacteria bacterium]
MGSIDTIPPFKSILVPINPEQVTPEFIQFAARLASQYQVALKLLFVLELPGHTRGAGFAVESDDESRDRVNALIEHEINPLLGGVDIDETIIEHGKPADIILDVADQRDIDVIVMGTRGKTGIAHTIMGSVTEKVVHLTHRPVLAIPVS